MQIELFVACNRITPKSRAKISLHGKLLKAPLSLLLTFLMQ